MFYIVTFKKLIQNYYREFLEQKQNKILQTT